MASVNKYKYFFLLLLILLCSPCSLPAQNNQEPEEQTTRGIDYQSIISGDLEDRIHQTLTQVSDTRDLEDRPPMTVAQLRRRARADVDKFYQALRSFGFYSSQISYSIDQTSSPVTVEFRIEPGPAYLIKKVDITLTCLETEPRPDLPTQGQLDLEQDSRITSARVLDARQIILKHVRKQGYPFPFVQVGEVIIDHQAHQAEIYYLLDPGPQADFGRTRVSGLSRVKEKYILQALPWQKGEPFNASLMNDLRRTLTGSGLFTMVEVKHETELQEDGNLPIIVSVTERKPRTARAGLRYQSDTGPEARLGWTHRNLRGMGEVLDFRLVVSEELNSLTGNYTIPAWLRTDQNLSFESGIVDEKREAYDSSSVYAQTMLERQLTPDLSAGVGLGYRAARVEQFGETNDLGLLYVPTDLTWDSRDDILNPGTGIRFNFKIIPFFDTLDTKNRFIKTYANVSTYLELLPEKRLVLANRMAVGTINAESKSKVPPDERFYAGGGGSVRGYSYQTAGELEDKTPVGGTSLAEINSELRLKLTKSSGLVAFLDGGRAFDTSYPNFEDRLYWGCGLGYRYFTDFGPVRVDIAFPLNRRKGVDDSFQIYISLGQAF
ncbi:MAG: autotransporter assembly complex family protein [Desulfonatronovibrio sp.]